MLEIGSFPVKEMVLGTRTRWQDGVLEIDQEEILALIHTDPHIREAAVDIVRPGEPVRVINYTDVVEPRVKVEGPGVVYPGVCGRPTTRVGTGRTHRLAGCAVVECIDKRLLSEEERYYPKRRQTGSPDPFFDMSGPNAVTPYASLLNLCLTMVAPPELTAEDRHHILHAATLRVADRLAQTVAHLTPPDREVFDLRPLPDRPGAVFIPHLSSTEWVTGARSCIGIAVYGQTRLSAPWLLDGTEMLDGAVSQGHTWM
ncbi:MAG: hypothetical protein D6736_07890, partial [Nitrospinota bacterium]